MITQRTSVEGLGEVAPSVGNLADNVRDLRGRLISVRNDAYARIKTAGTAKLGKTEGTRVAVEFDYIKGEFPVAVEYDKLSLDLARRAVIANSQGKYSCTDSTERYDKKRKIAEREEKSGVSHQERTAVLLPREDFNMSPLKNPNHFAFFLKDLAEKEGESSYFVLNGNNPIRVYLVDKAIVDGKKDSQLLENPNGTIVVPYAWFRSLVDGSGLGGLGSAVSCDYGARGVLSGAPKAPQKTSRTSKLKLEVTQALRRRQPFEYNGTLYVPVRKGISLK